MRSDEMGKDKKETGGDKLRRDRGERPVVDGAIMAPHAATGGHTGAPGGGVGSDEKVASQLKKMITPIVIKRLSAKKRSVSDAFLDDKEKFKAAAQKLVHQMLPGSGHHRALTHDLASGFLLGAPDKEEAVNRLIKVCMCTCACTLMQPQRYKRIGSGHDL